MKTTQRDMVVNYIRDFGSITSWEAYTELGITQLGARIFELKERGYIFHKEKVKKLNRYGKQITFDKYKIIFEGGIDGRKDIYLDRESDKGSNRSALPV